MRTWRRASLAFGVAQAELVPESARLHVGLGSEFGVDDFHAALSPEGRYRTAPLKGLRSRQTGGFYHDGRFATLADVVDHDDNFFGLCLAAGAKSDLVQFLLSL